MQTTAYDRDESQSSSRADIERAVGVLTGVQKAAQWLRQTGLKDDNYDGRQWWEESDSEGDFDTEASPVQSQAPDDEVPSSPTSFAHYYNEEDFPIEPEQPFRADHPPPKASLRWQKDGYNAAYFGPIEDPNLMPAPLTIRKGQPAPKTPSSISRKPVPSTRKHSSTPQTSRPEVHKPLPALPDMRVTGYMANGVEILSLAEAQTRHRAAGYAVPAPEETPERQLVETAVTPQAPVRRGTAKRMILGLSKLARSSTTSGTPSSTPDVRQESEPTETAQIPPSPQSPTVVGNANRNTRWEDFMPHSPNEPPPTRHPPPPPTQDKCPCPEHRAERAATYTIPRKPVPPPQEGKEELVHSPSVQNEINRLPDRFQLSFDPDDDYDREPIVDTFVRAGHTSIHITNRLDQNTLISHYGREERLDGDENFEKARAKLAAYYGA